MIMEFNSRITPVSRALATPGLVVILTTAIFCLSVSSLSADTYRWKDKDGKVHYGASVPPEHADMPYDILNNSGMVILHVENTTIPVEVLVEQKIEEEEPLISDKERQRQSDRLLMVQYSAEEDVQAALELQLSQLSNAVKIIDQSYDSTNKAIRDQVRLAGDQQRANQQISADQREGINQLYARRARDDRKRAKIAERENQIRLKFQSDLERFRALTAKNNKADEERADQG